VYKSKERGDDEVSGIEGARRVERNRIYIFKPGWFDISRVGAVFRQMNVRKNYSMIERP